MKKKILISGIVCSAIAGITIVTSGLFGNNYSNDKIVHASKVENDNSTIDKSRIQTLMLNSIDNYTSAKGTFEYLSTSGNYHLLIDYQTDLSENPRSYEKVRVIEEKDTKSAYSFESGYEISAYDGKNLINYNSGSKDFEVNSVTKSSQPEIQTIPVAKVSKNERSLLKDSTIDERIIKIDGEKAYVHKIDPTYMGIAKTSLLPEDIAMGFLEDDKKWDISGQENIAGINTIVIKGDLNKSYSERYNAGTFKLNVDPKTGIMLQMEVYDSAGVIKELIKTNDIQINEELDEALFTEFN